MSIYIGASELKDVYIGANKAKEVYVGTTKVRPKSLVGIYHNSGLGLISLSPDGETWKTIADKNLGATTVWNSGNTLSQANCGNFYQWGNNYGFPFAGGVATSSTQVNASNYGPGNYYNSSTFITINTRPYDWSNVQNDNLWGAVTGTNEAMKGPCPSGFHVPLTTEWQAIKDIWTSLGGGNSGTNFGIALKLPFAGYRHNTDAGAISQGTYGNYWSSSRKAVNGSYKLYFYSVAISITDGVCSAGYSVRPFKNEAVKPDSSRTKLYPLA